MGNKGQYIPWMRSLLNTMKEKYGKPDAKTIAEALPDIGSGSGGEVTPASVAVAIHRMSDAQAAQALSDLGYTVDAILDVNSANPVQNRALSLAFLAAQAIVDDKADKSIVIEIDSSITTPTITPEDNHEYQCGELASLTISNPPATGKYSIIFYSGSTPTTTVGVENFTAEANKRYKITVEDNYATYDSWDWEGV